MKKNIFYALMMPALMLGAVSCTDYQDDIDKLGAENDALRSYNNQTISQLNSVVFQTEEGVVNITVDQPAAATIVYEVEPKELASTLAADITHLKFVTQHDAAMAITAAAGDDAKGTLTVTATPSGFDGSKDYSLSLIYSEDARSYQTAYTPVYVITHPTAGSLAITIPTTSGGKYAVGANYQLSAVFTPAYITETGVTWSVDDTTLATISEDGVFTPIKNGTVTITCTSKDNPAVSATVTIEITGGNIPLDEGGVSQGGAE
ncbi:Ig-like domain-containing protein [Prevotella sp. E9-3]|uniref:Ig-like domain-containing protein n=1 Tax=Prevotella sp. E9-3 TaxID=2913621 RepID=UPI001EDB9E03|nr:Ig-like domain-containing protein [Prevotella sp. E9-3]UKK49628.1 Ig-like domain-containing protein [Prevotella sp. E9-3]